MQWVLDLVREAGDDLAHRGQAAGANELVEDALKLAPARPLALGQQPRRRADEVVQEDLETLVEAAARVVVVARREREGVREVDERGRGSGDKAAAQAVAEGGEDDRQVVHPPQDVVCPSVLHADAVVQGGDHGDR